MNSKTDKTNKKPTTMAELLANADNKMVIPKKGAVVSGIITAINKKSLMLDIGAKTEGIVVDKEFDNVSFYWSRSYSKKSLWV